MAKTIVERTPIRTIKKGKKKKEKRKKNDKWVREMDFEVDNDGNKILKKSSPSSITVIFADGVRSNLLSRAFDHFRLVLLAAEQTEKMEV